VTELPREYAGWWRIVEASTWDNGMLDLIGTALISITGRADRLRMFALLADVNWKTTKTGLSFRWAGAWEYDQMTGTGSVRLRKDGKLSGRFAISDGDKCTFVAERTDPPPAPIPEPPRYEDKWSRRRW
jgi:hypothetical protein